MPCKVRSPSAIVSFTIILYLRVIKRTHFTSGISESSFATSCLYHAELPNGITDVALVNASNETLNFNDGEYSVTMSAHGTAIQHIASNQTVGR